MPESPLRPASSAISASAKEKPAAISAARNLLNELGNGRKSMAESLSSSSRNSVLRAIGTGRFSRSIAIDRKSTRLNSSHVAISYAVFCLKKKKEGQRKLAVGGAGVRDRAAEGEHHVARELHVSVGHGRQ